MTLLSFFLILHPPEGLTETLDPAWSPAWFGVPHQTQEAPVATCPCCFLPPFLNDCLSFPYIPRGALSAHFPRREVILELPSRQTQDSSHRV